MVWRFEVCFLLADLGALWIAFGGIITVGAAWVGQIFEGCRLLVLVAYVLIG